MKKKLICFAAICLLIIPAGCGSSASNGGGDLRNALTEGDAPGKDNISLTPEMSELETGFSAVRYDGDYAFDRFLERGGAKSDQEVLQFLTETMF